MFIFFKTSVTAPNRMSRSRSVLAAMRASAMPLSATACCCVL
jgi:hypothetical protein